MWNDSRYGYRGMPAGGGLPPVLKNLLIANFAVFLLQIAGGPEFTRLFGLHSPSVIGRLHLWQFATYMFLHGNVFHIAINMFLLFMFGRELEEMWGGKNFLKFYLVCGTGAGIVTYFFTMGTNILTIGASGAVFGILVAYAVIFPEREITLFLFFVLPLQLKAKHLVMILGFLEFLHVLAGTEDGIGHYAHLGGAVIGFIYLKVWRDISYHGTDPGTLLRLWQGQLKDLARRLGGDKKH